MAEGEEVKTDRLKPHLRALGFCGADDSCDPLHLQVLSQRFPFIEWGV